VTKISKNPNISKSDTYERVVQEQRLDKKFIFMSQDFKEALLKD